MKVLIINSVCNGSTGHIAQDIARDFISKGDECVIAYGRGNPPKQIKSYKIGNNLSVYWHVLITRLFDKHGFGSKYATKKFVKFIKDYNPDLIWLHNIHGYYINIKILFNYLRDSCKKVKWTLHDCWAFTGHCPHFEYIKCSKWKKECSNCPNKKKYPSSFFLDNSKRNFFKKKQIFNSLENDNLQLIVPSQWLEKLVKESFLNKYSVQVVNNTINLDVFKPVTSNIKEKYGIIEKKIILGVSSVWNDSKGLKDFIELSYKISDDFIIVLIGLNDKQIRVLPKKILGIKRTENQHELIEWYSVAFCFFDPTYEDNYPTVLLEANACGCTTISYDTGGCREISKYIVNDINEFLDKIKML